MQTSKANMERMVEEVPGSDWDAMQNFLSDSPWQHRPILQQIGWDTSDLLGEHPDNFLLVDETACTKKGKKSVGVARQWNGRLGKVDNCQVGVFTALGRESKVTLTNFRLFLPKEWTDNKRRCRRAHVPSEHIRPCSKIDLALEMVKDAKAQGLNFGWVGADGFYGRDSHFRRRLGDMELTYMVDIPKDTTIYSEDPKPGVPPKASNKGRSPIRLKASVKGVRLDKWLEKQPDTAFEKITVRDTTKGYLIAQFLQRTIWLWDGKSPEAEKVHLIIRKDKGQSQTTIKYSVSNASLETSIERLAYMQCQRYWIERAFEDSKSSAGMADYQVRGWRAWHHHMTLVALATLFMLTTKIKHQKEYELLSAADIKHLLSRFLPQRQISKQSVIEVIKERHRKRKKDIDLHSKT